MVMLLRKKIINYTSFFILSLLIFNLLTACSVTSKKTESSKELNLYVEVRDKDSLDIIKSLVDGYKKQNPGIKANINDVLDKDNTAAYEINKNKVDILFTSRSKMIDYAKKGLLMDMSNYYDKNKINDKFDRIITSYGRYTDKYYGIGLAPNALEIVYNKNALSGLGLGIPRDMNELVNLIKTAKSKSIRIPVVFTEDIDIYSGISSLIANNIIKEKELESSYQSADLQQMFNYINSLVKQGIIDKNTFETGNETTIKAFPNGNSPILITLSKYNSNLDKSDIGLLENYGTFKSIQGNIPVIMNCVLSIATNSKNTEETSNFVKYVYSESVQKKLVKNGIITGNKKADNLLSGINASASGLIAAANENSIFYEYNLPEEFSQRISNRITDILNGKYTGNEWKNVIEGK